MVSSTQNTKLLTEIRLWVGFFIIALAGSGITAIPLEWELGILTNLVNTSIVANNLPQLVEWIEKVNAGIVNTNAAYPFMAYGTDWLAFGHIIIAISFIGAFIDPERNVWIIYVGMMACILIIPWTLVFGYVREIPFGWQLIDMSFGVFGIIPLLVVRKRITQLSESQKNQG